MSVAADGNLKVDAWCAPSVGVAINPDNIRSQVEGAIGTLTAMLNGEITLKERRVEQGNFDSYPLLRIGEMPKVEGVYRALGGETDRHRRTRRAAAGASSGQRDCRRHRQTHHPPALRRGVARKPAGRSAIALRAAASLVTVACSLATG